MTLQVGITQLVDTMGVLHLGQRQLYPRQIDGRWADVFLDESGLEVLLKNDVK